MKTKICTMIEDWDVKLHWLKRFQHFWYGFKAEILSFQTVHEFLILIYSIKSYIEIEWTYLLKREQR